MSMLHLVNKSPFERNTLDACLRLAKTGSSVLLMEDGIYAAMKGTAKSAAVSNAMANITFYVLGPDLNARGISEDQVIDGIKVVGYSDFVNLVVEHDNNQTWL